MEQITCDECHNEAVEHLCFFCAEKYDKLHGTYSGKITKLRKEIEILRLYGNKDCTAYADEVLAEIDKSRQR